jgi:hypothetical protein
VVVAIGRRKPDFGLKSKMMLTSFTGRLSASKAIA